MLILQLYKFILNYIDLFQIDKNFHYDYAFRALLHSKSYVNSTGLVLANSKQMQGKLVKFKGTILNFSNKHDCI